MAIKRQDRFGAIFTVVFVGSILVIIQLVPISLSYNDKILFAAACVAIISAAGIYSYRKKSSKSSADIGSRLYILLFGVGIFLGMITTYAVEIVRDPNYQRTDAMSFLLWILLAFAGYSGMYYFTAMAMFVTIVHLPPIRRKLSGHSAWIPFVEGTTFGLGVMVFLQLFWHGLPKS